MISFCRLIATCICLNNIIGLVNTLINMAENCYDIHNGVRYPVLQKLHEIVIEIDQNIILILYSLYNSTLNNK